MRQKLPGLASATKTLADGTRRVCCWASEQPYIILMSINLNSTF